MVDFKEEDYKKTSLDSLSLYSQRPGLKRRMQKKAGYLCRKHVIRKT